MTGLDRFRLPKEHLLRSNGEFQRVYRSGRRLRGEGFALIVCANSLAHNRLGISVHRKSGSAVVRNRIKRLVRETFRLNRDMFPAASDIVVTIRPGFAIMSLADMHLRMARTLGG